MAVGIKLSKEDSEPFDYSTLYRRIIEGLQYLTLSRPDLAFTITKLSQFLQAQNVAHRKTQHFILERYPDVDWANDVSDRKSMSGYNIFLGWNLVQWSFGKQNVVSLSSTKTEYRSLSQAATELV
ncbi:uncharacterized protein LOC116139109 [Pistacia vera]|uniref:uncharacterized protein LOC116139109 n=1 Tax=Pistacia vera TaxID=55513 RepID=UPI0012632F9C|nr:uncharacterized protein LOC116139109 [Pistacia vera]